VAPTGCSKARVVAPVGARTARSRRSSRSRRDGAVADWTYLIATLKALALPPVEYHVTESVLLPILNLCGIFTVELIFVPVFALLVKRVRCKNDSGTLSKLRGAKRRCVAIMRGAHEERSDEEYTRSGATRSTRRAKRRLLLLSRSFAPLAPRIAPRRSAPHGLLSVAIILVASLCNTLLAFVLTSRHLASLDRLCTYFSAFWKTLSLASSVHRLSSSTCEVVLSGLVLMLLLLLFCGEEESS